MLALICVQSICIILMLWHKYSAPLQHRRNWCQPPLPTARRPSRSNSGSPVLTPANVGPSRPPPPHQRPIQSICTIRPVAKQPAHKIHFLLAKKTQYQYNPANTIQPIQSRLSSQYDQADTIQPIRSRQSTRYYPDNPCNTTQPILPSHILLWRAPPNNTKPNQKDTSSVTLAADFSPSPAASAARHLLSFSDVVSYAAFFASAISIRSKEGSIRYNIRER